MSCNYNVGQKLTLSATTTGENNVGVVWGLWDGSTVLTPPDATPQLERALNRGGDIGVTVTIVDDLGRSSTAAQEFYVNLPPAFISTTVSDNYSTFPFSTDITATAIDLDGDSNLITWNLYSLDANGNQVNLLGSSSPQITGSNFSAHILVSASIHVYLAATDMDGGTTIVQFDLSGLEQIAQAPNALPMTLNPFDGQVISSSSKITASVVVTAPSQPTSFLWTFWTDPDGITGGIVSSDHGTTVEISPGVWCNTILRGTADAPPNGGRQTVTCVVTYADGSYTSPAIIGTTLLYKALPPIYQVTATVNPSTAVVPGTALTYSARATLAPDGGDLDQDGYTQRGGDTLFYKWVIMLPLDFPEEYTTVPADFPTHPAVNVPSNPTISGRQITLYGPSVTVPTTAMFAGDTITAILTVTSNLGGSVTSSPTAVTLVAATTLTPISLATA